MAILYEGQPFGVVPRTRAQQMRRVWSTALLTAGLLVDALAKAAPQIEHALPAWTWLPRFVAACGGAILVWQRYQDAGRIATANYSGASPAPLPDGVPMPIKADKDHVDER